MKVMAQQWNTKFWILKMNIKVQTTSSESHNQCVRVATYIYIYLQ
jgi:hypothetical protein